MVVIHDYNFYILFLFSKTQKNRSGIVAEYLRTLTMKITKASVVNLKSIYCPVAPSMVFLLLSQHVSGTQDLLCEFL